MKTILAIVLLLPLPASAVDLTFHQTLHQALEHSHALKKAAALIDASHSSLDAARAERWPSLSFSGTAQVIDDIPIIQFPGGVNRELGSKETYQTDVRLTLPLFTGGKISSGVDLARASRELQEALAKGDSDRVAFTVWNEYLGLQRADRMVEVAQASLKRAEIISANVTSLYTAGVADSIDLNDTRLALARARLGVTQALNQKRSAEIRTAILVGADPVQSINPTSTPTDPTDTIIADFTHLSDDKSELRASQAAVAAARARVHLTIGDFLPSVSAYGGYAYGKPNGDFFNDSWRDYWLAGANLSWSFNLGGKALSKNKSARYELISAQSDQNREAEQLSRDARLAREQVRLALARCENARTEYQISSDQFRQAQQRHQNGDLSSNRLLDIETSLTAAQSSLSASVSDFWLSIAYWYYATGSNRLREGF
jgi:outer membrane protein TolC